jgi:hypothetical protein
MSLGRAALAAAGVLAGFGITFGILQAVVHPGAAASGAASASPSGAESHGQDAPTQGRSVIAATGLSPAALDAQWLAYSDHSRCDDWAGGDGVSAVRLNSSQIAWFFADTFLGPATPTTGFSHLSGFLHNSVVVQTKAGSRTSLITLSGPGGCSIPGDPTPSSVVSAPTTAQGQQRYWDADGIRVGRSVIKFYNSYLLGPIPYVPTGTAIARFSVSVLSVAGRARRPSHNIRPTLTPVPAYTPPSGGTPIMWGSALLTSGRTVYVYGWQSPSASSSVRQLYVARVSIAKLADFAAWQFYAGAPDSWSPSQSQAVPVGVTQDFNVPSAFSVVRAAGRYWLIDAPGDGGPDIDAYPAPAPWGPFEASNSILLYRAPGIGLDAADDYRIMYEARAEPALSTGKALVISYNVNSEAVTGACVSILHYTNTVIQPRFISVPWTVFAHPGDDIQADVSAGSPGYPPIVQQDPADWFDSWSYAGGCPPVPAMSHLTARARRGLVRLSWPSAGIGLRYRVYLGTGPDSLEFVRTVSLNRITLTGLTPDQTYEAEVVPLSIHADTGPSAHIFIRVP